MREIERRIGRLSKKKKSSGIFMLDDGLYNLSIRLLPYGTHTVAAADEVHCLSGLPKTTVSIAKRERGGKKTKKET